MSLHLDEVGIAVAIMRAEVADEAQALRPFGIAGEQRAFVVARDSFREDRVADRDPVVVAVTVDQLVARPAGAHMIEDDVVALEIGVDQIAPAVFYYSAELNPTFLSEYT